MDRVFTGGITDGRVSLPEAVSHVRKVLRLKSGDTFAGYDGADEYELLLRTAHSDSLEVEILSERELSPGPAENVVLAASVLKAKRWDFLLEKAVELGACAVWPVLARRCVVNLDKKAAAEKRERWLKIMRSAAAQCAGKLPELTPPAPLGDVLARADAAPGKFVLHKSGDSKPFPLALADSSPAGMVLLTGPEGDWAPDELEAIDGAGFTPAHLGSRILRAETAGIAAMSIAAALAGPETGRGAAGCPFYSSGSD